MDKKISLYRLLHCCKTENENCNRFQIYPSIVIKCSSKKSLCHKDSKSVFKVDIDGFEVGFYSGIKEGQTNGQTDPLPLS